MRFRLALLSFMVVALAGPAHAQFRGIRFEISRVGDTTLAFPRGSEKWIKAGQSGIAVDPRRRDALVARFRVVGIDSGFVMAVVTGQTTRIVTDHIAILDEPRRPWYKTVLFWGGMAIGAALGTMVGSQM